MLTSAAPAAVATPAAIRSAARSLFFPAYAAALLAAVLAAFAPSFYLRPPDAAPLPPYLAVHGTVLTAWFVLLGVQGALVAARAPKLHRRLGVLGAVLGTAVAATGLLATWRFVPRLRDAGVDVEAALPQLSGIFFGDLGLLASFVVLLASAIAARRRPPAHKRLMLLASFTLMPPAFARIAAWPPLGLGGLSQVMFALGALLVLNAVLVAYDLALERRVHGATLFGVAVVLLLAVGALFAGGSDAARSFVRGLG